MNSKNSKEIISIIIPYYHGEKYIEDCITSLQLNKLDTYSIDIIIVNNSVRPQPILATISNNYSNITIIEAPSQIGFGKANNLGYKHAKEYGSKYCVFLNQDTIVDKILIAELIKPFEYDSSVWFTGPQSFDYGFSRIEKHFIQWYLPQCPEYFFDSLNQTIKAFYEMKNLSGVCFAMPTEVINKIGLFDPLYFMYMEDDDLCRRIKYFNKKIILVPSARIAHAHSNGDEISIEDDIKINLLKRRSRFIFILKDLNRSISFNFLKLLNNLISDYFNCFFHFRFSTLFRYIIIDLKALTHIKSIIKSRNAEKANLND